MPSPLTQPPLPSFILGITGNTDPVGYQHDPTLPDTAEIIVLKQTLWQVLDWLRGKTAAGQPVKAWLDPVKRGLIRALPATKPMVSHETSEEELQKLWSPLDLGDTLITVLTSLAPGIDTLAAEVALDYADAQKAAGQEVTILVRAALPFPLDDLRQCSTLRPPGSPEAWPSISRRFENVLTRIQAQQGFFEPRDLFHVPLQQDVDPEEARDPADDLTASEPMTDGTGARLRCNLRYRAAGEYVAAYSDILLAAFDPVYERDHPTDYRDPFVPGTAAIVEVMRRGLTDGLLPIPQTIAWGDTGPVLHIPIARQKNSAGNLASSTAPLRLLQPYDIKPRDVDDADDAHPLWQKNGDRVLRSIAANLKTVHEEFSAEAGVPEDADSALADLLADASPAEPSAARQAVEKCATYPFAGYANLLALMDRFACGYNGRVQAHKRLLFFTAIAGSLCFLASGGDVRDLFSHPGKGMISLVAFACGGLLAWSAYRTHQEFTRQRTDDRQFDYRAATEGLRVQFYWSVSGLFASVASRYVERLRGELSWIRCFISSVSFPYKRARDWFHKLSLEEKHSILQAVWTGWIRDQSHYFNTTLNGISLKRDILKLHSRTLFFAGLIISTHSILAVAHLLPSSLIHAGTGTILLSSLLPIALSVIIFANWFALPSPLRKKCDWTFWANPLPELLPHRDPRFSSQETGIPNTHTLSDKSRLFSYRVYIALTSTGLAFIAIFGTQVLSWLGWLPPLEESATSNLPAAIFKVIVFALSGLLMVWVQQSFMEEDERRYSAMFTLFHAAERRMLEKLIHLRAAMNDPQPAVPPNDIVEDIQSLLQSLGEESLTENAEWLILRRSRRLKPHTLKP